MVSTMGLELLEQHIRQRVARDEAARLKAREMLRHELARWVPRRRIWLYGSIIRPNHFDEWSDVDLALEVEPGPLSLCALMGLLRESLHREVDVVLLEETRLREKILREGELWIA